MASVGQARMHLPQRMHSVSLGDLVMSTSIWQVRAHLPQETHLLVSTWMPSRETLFISA